MAKLVPCTHCQRHVRLDGGECPFCGAEVVAPVAQARSGKLPARLLLTAAALSLGVACADDDGGSTVALYGAPSDDDAAASSSATGGGMGGAGGMGGEMNMTVGVGGMGAGGGGTAGAGGN